MFSQQLKCAVSITELFQNINIDYIWVTKTYENSTLKLGKVSQLCYLSNNLVIFEPIQQKCKIHTVEQTDVQLACLNSKYLICNNKFTDHSNQAWISRSKINGYCYVLFSIPKPYKRAGANSKHYGITENQALMIILGIN